MDTVLRIVAIFLVVFCVLMLVVCALIAHDTKVNPKGHVPPKPIPPPAPRDHFDQEAA